MSWKTQKPSQFSLNEAARAMFPGSACWASKFNFRVKIVKNGKVLYEDREEADIDYLCRLAIPALAIVLPFAVWWAGTHPFMHGQAGALLVMAVIGGLGVLCYDNLDESFESGVREQLRVARAATSKAEMTAALLKLIWGMRERRPPFATVIRPWVLWWRYSNNVNRFALEPAHSALKLLDGMGDAQGKLTWFERTQFDGYFNQIESKLGEMSSVWDRSIKLPRVLLGVSWYCGSVLFLIVAAIPLLKIWAGR
jgi:hypothetical protein